MEAVRGGEDCGQKAKAKACVGLTLHGSHLLDVEVLHLTFHKLNASSSICVGGPRAIRPPFSHHATIFWYPFGSNGLHTRVEHFISRFPYILHSHRPRLAVAHMAGGTGYGVRLCVHCAVPTCLVCTSFAPSASSQAVLVSTATTTPTDYRSFVRLVASCVGCSQYMSVWAT